MLAIIANREHPDQSASLFLLSKEREKESLVWACGAF